MGRIKYTAEDRQRIVSEAQKLRASGKTLKETVKALGVSDHTLYRFSEALGVKLENSRGIKTPTTEVRVFHNNEQTAPQKRGPKPVVKSSDKIAVIVCKVNDLSALLEAALR